MKGERVGMEKKKDKRERQIREGNRKRREREKEGCHTFFLMIVCYFDLTISNDTAPGMTIEECTIFLLVSFVFSSSVYF